MSEWNQPPSQNKDKNAIMLEQMRQHVNNLMAATHLLTPAVRETHQPKYDQYLAIMNQSYYSLLRLMDHMEFTQELEQENVPFHPTPLDLAGLCQEITDLTIPLAKMAGISFRYDSELSSLLTMGDAVLLRRMLLGLFSNALCAAKEGGEAGLHLAKQRTNAILTIWDNGPGLDRPGQPEVLYRPSGAMGMGLPIVRELVRLHGGAVMLENRPERGMRAIVSLPIQAPPPGFLRTPKRSWDKEGGFSPALVEFSSFLPNSAFRPEDLE